MKKFDTSSTLEAFLKVEGLMKDLLTLRVHQELLQGSFLVKRCKYLRNQLEHIERIDGQVLLVDFIGKLAVRMPSKIVEGAWDDYQKELIKKTAAALLINVLIDSGEYKLTSEVESQGDGKFITKLYIEFDNEVDKKNLLWGLEEKPGIFYQKHVEGVSLSFHFKNMLTKVGSMPFKLSSICSKEYLMKGYSLSKDYNSKGKKGGESRLAKRRRYADYADYIMDKVAPMEQFYLPMKYDSRGRMYYLFQLIGVRPQGQLWETLMIDSAKPKKLSMSSLPHLQHIIYCTRYGRSTVEDALENFTDDDYHWATKIDPMTATTEDEFGEYLLASKAAYAVYCLAKGIECHYLFGKDLTNSGLMTAAANFKSSKMITASNLSNDQKVYDSYSIMQDAFGLEGITRKDMKKILTPMLHGASLNSLVKNVQSALLKNGQSEYTANTVDIDFVMEANEEAFGEEVSNLFTISSWGSSIVNNNRTKLYWKSPDGFKAFHKASLAHCPVTVYAATAGTSSFYRRTNHIATMPLKEKANGYSLYPKGFTAPGSKKPVEVKKTGLYANITHSFDAALLRRVVDNVVDKGEVCLLKHDDYMVFPDAYDDIIVTVRDFFKESSQTNHYANALNDIASKCEGVTPPKLIVGDGVVGESVNMLMP